MHAIPLAAGDAGRSEFGHSRMVEGLPPERRLDRVARRGDAGAGLAGVDGAAQSQRDAFGRGHLGEAQGVGRGAAEHGGLQVAHHLHALNRRHGAARYRHRAEPLRPAERGPEADEWPKGEGEEDPVV